jgi:hypothetical protein
MATKDKPTNLNTNNNTSNVNVNVKVEGPKRQSPKKKSSNWLPKAVIGGIIALLLSAGGYYIKKSMDDKGANSGTVSPNGKPVEGKKEN